MSYQVIARKWRPQNFKEVVFQDHVSRTLQNSIKNDRISHAYLFSGPRGVGKTTVARILAKSLNCLANDKPTIYPCGVCASCQEIKNGTSFDVIEIDGASNRGIEDIRELRENVNFAPLKSRYKVYIIDEVHMLTKEAFNALLKTLEEPPRHVVFVFATTEVHQIPDTILSRCQKYLFKKIPIEIIVQHLLYITKEEKFDIDSEALYPLARAADGSMRDAQSLLDQVLSFSSTDEKHEQSIDVTDVLAILGIVPLDSYTIVLQNIIENNSRHLIEEIGRICEMGVDIPRYVAGLMDVIRTIRLVKHNFDVSELFGFSNEENKKLVHIAKSFHDEELSILFKLLNGLINDLKYSTNERINLEMTVLDMLSAKTTPSITSIVQKIDSAIQGDNGPGSEQIDAAVSGKFETGKKKIDDEHKYSATDKDLTGQKNGVKNIDLPFLQKKWIQFLQSIKEEKKYLHFVLMPATVSYKDNTLVLNYPAGVDHSYHFKILNRDTRSYIQDQMGTLLGFDIALALQSEQGAEGEIPDKNNKGESFDPGANPGLVVDDVPPPDAELVSNPEIDDFKPVNPTVNKIKDVFSGEIIEKENNNA